MITKELLLKLYKNNDSSRKRSLYKHYKDIIDSDASREYIVQYINEDLGKNIITLNDIKYCRSELRGKALNVAIPKTVLTSKIQSATIKEPKRHLDFELTITDPDTISENKNILKSKHASN